MVCPDLPLHLGLPHRAYSAQDFVVKNLALVAVFGSMSLCLGDEPRNLALVRFLAYAFLRGCNRFLLCFAERRGSPAHTWGQASEGAPPIDA